MVVFTVVGGDRGTVVPGEGGRLVVVVDRVERGVVVDVVDVVEVVEVEDVVVVPIPSGNCRLDAGGGVSTWPLREYTTGNCPTYSGYEASAADM